LRRLCDLLRQFSSGGVRCIALFVSVTLCLVAASSASPAPGSAAIAANGAGTPLEAEIIAQINAFRASQGLSPLVSSPVLAAFAARHAQDMLAKGYFDHDEPGGQTALQRLTAFFGPEGYDLSNVGENIAMISGPGDATAFVQEWLGDQAHQEILLGTGRGPLYSEVGVAVVTADSAPGVYAGLGQVSILSAAFGPPQPLYGQSVVVAPVSGIVLVKAPGAKNFTVLKAGALIDSGTEVDTTKGRVRLTSVADDAGTVQTADFYRGRFVVTYTPDFPGVSTNLLTNLRLSGRLTGCRRVAAARHLAAQSKKPPKRRRTRPRKAKGPKVQSLWGNGVGHFSTQTGYASAVVRGTYWLTQETCTSTRVRVVSGIVDVFDAKRNIHTSVPAGHSLVVRKSK
jgi:uncharacterized protein YkwD